MKGEAKGVFYILLSTLFFAIMAAMVKSLPHISIPQKIVFRNLVGVIIVGIYLIKRRENLIVDNIKLLALRSIFGLLGVVGYYYAISKLPLADAVLLNRMSPFFVILLSLAFLNEKINKLQISAMLLAIMGAALVIKPQFDYTIFPALIGILSAIFAASAYVTLRQLRLYASSEAIVFFFSLFSVIMAWPFMFFGYYSQPTTLELMILVGIGLSATAAQLFMTMAYRHAPASKIAIYNYVNIIFSALLGIIIWQEYPDLMSFSGGTLIILAGIINYIAGKESSINGNETVQE